MGARHRRSLIKLWSSGAHRRVPLWLAVVVLVALLAVLTALYAYGLGAEQR